MTPLIHACKKGYLDVIKVLIDYGADINVKDKVSLNAMWHVFVMCLHYILNVWLCMVLDE